MTARASLQPILPVRLGPVPISLVPISLMPISLMPISLMPISLMSGVVQFCCCVFGRPVLRSRVPVRCDAK